MNHNYTDTELQSAMDKAFAGSKPILFDADPANSIWGSQKLARLDLIKSALAALPEPEPPTVDWKAKAERMEHERNGWSQMHGDMKVRAEKAEVELAAAKESIESQTRVYRKDTEFLEKKLHEAIIKPSLSQLRPLAEAGPVPEGCLRFYTYKKDEEWTTATKYRAMQDTHYIDTRLPESEPMSTKPISLPLAESMSLRDWFAGQALAMLADPDFNHSPEDTARLVYRIADAMLAAREVKP